MEQIIEKKFNFYRETFNSFSKSSIALFGVQAIRKNGLLCFRGYVRIVPFFKIVSENSRICSFSQYRDFRATPKTD